MARSGFFAVFSAVTFVITLLISVGTSSAQQDFSAIEIETVKITDQIYALYGAGGNIGLSIGDDGIFIVDDQYAPLTEKIQAAIAALDSRPVKFVINTHWHFDHTGGNENLGNAGAVIIAHDNVYARMSTDQSMPAFNREVPAAPRIALPAVTFNDRATLHLNGEDVQIIHVEAAHTDGDSILYWPESNVIHAGDTYFHKRFPFVDTGSGGSLVGMIAAADIVQSLANHETQIIPGHGPMSTKAQHLAYREMLATMRDRTIAAIDEGLSADEFVASAPAADFQESIDADPTSFLRIIHADLSRNR